MRIGTTSDGMKIGLYPHITDGTPPYGPDAPYDHVHMDKVYAYQESILKRIDDYDLWKYQDKPGKMSSEYRKLRKLDPEMKTIVAISKQTIKSKPNARVDMEKLIPRSLWYYPFPGSIYDKQNVANADWLITQEMKAVFVLALKNTKEDPSNPSSKLYEQMKGLNAAERAEIARQSGLAITLYNKREWYLGPQAAIPYTLFDEKFVPRSFKDTVTERYDHTSPLHNQALRTTSGALRAEAYLVDETVDSVEEPVAKIIEPKAKEKK